MSARVLRISLVFLATAGFGVAGYLTYVHYAGINPVCTTGGSCEKVQTSVYSELAGVPVALLGLLAYGVILGSLLVPQREATRFTTMVVTLAAFAFSGYLTYRELYSVHAICEWCVSSAVILTLMAPLSLWWFLRGAARETYPQPSPDPRQVAAARPRRAEAVTQDCAHRANEASRERGHATRVWSAVPPDR
jgi:uncharacterized membrane protein